MIQGQIAHFPYPDCSVMLNEGGVFRMHRVVLASSLAYFRAPWWPQQEGSEKATAQVGVDMDSRLAYATFSFMYSWFNLTTGSVRVLKQTRRQIQVPARGLTTGSRGQLLEEFMRKSSRTQPYVHQVEVARLGGWVHRVTCR